MRRDGKPVRPGIGTTRQESRVFEPAKQIGTPSTDTIKASGSTSPRQQAGHKTVPDVAIPSKILATREPSTQDYLDDRPNRLRCANNCRVRRLAVPQMTLQTWHIAMPGGETSTASQSANDSRGPPPIRPTADMPACCSGVRDGITS
jgi:hypothetical protein